MEARLSWDVKIGGCRWKRLTMAIFSIIYDLVLQPLLRSDRAYFSPSAAPWMRHVARAMGTDCFELSRSMVLLPRHVLCSVW